jgi:hypothetical protein
MVVAPAQEIVYGVNFAPKVSREALSQSTGAANQSMAAW